MNLNKKEHPIWMLNYHYIHKELIQSEQNLKTSIDT
jgi:hypothetical protein